MIIRRRTGAVVALATASWLVAVSPASAVAYASGSITTSVPAAATSGTFAALSGSVTCSATKPCLKATGTLKANKVSVSGSMVMQFYRNTANATGGTLLGSVTSSSFSIPSGSTATYTQSLAYQCKTVSTTTTSYYYSAKTTFMTASGTMSTDTSSWSTVLKAAKSCAS